MNRLDVIRALLKAADVLNAAAAGRVYVLHKDAEGKQVGDWITPDADPDILEAQIRDTTQQPAGTKLEFSVTEYEDFPDIGERPKLSTLAQVVTLLQGSPVDVVSAALEVAGRDVSNAAKLIELGYTIHKDDEDYAYSVVGDVGGPQNLGDDTLMAYFDFEKYGRDLMLEVINADLKDGRIVVFNKPKKDSES